MLELCLGVDWKENRRWLLRRVCRQASAKHGGNILVVPDQFSHEMERQLCTAGGDHICRYAEVLSFSRLADRVFATCGGVADVAMDNGGRLVAMAAAIDQVRSRLKLYGNCGEKPEFLLQLLNTVDECKAFCITPEVLRRAAQQATGSLAVKLEELALLAESYDAVCANGAQDAGSRLMKLSECLLTCDYAAGKTFYFEGFSDFNALELQILLQLLEAGAPVTVVLLCDDLARGQGVFDCSRETARQLLQAASRAEIPTQCTTIHPGAVPEGIAYLREHLFGSCREPFAQESCDVQLFVSGSVHREVEEVAGRILQQVQAGKRYRQISVACGEMERYQPVVRNVFARYGIPAYFSGNDDILRKPVVQTVLFALEAATGGMEQDAVFAYLKSGLSPLERDRCDRLENYAITWNIRGNAWHKPWAQHPNGSRQAMDESAQQQLAQLNVDRQTAMDPLLHLKQGLRDATNTAQQVLSLYDFMEEIAYSKRLNEIANTMAEQGDLQKAQEYAQLYQILVTAMEQFYTVLGHTVRSADAFYRLLRTLLSQYAVGTIPATLDCVTVGSCMSMRQNRTDILFVLGACDGAFPANSEEQGLLSDMDRKQLRKMGIAVAPGVQEKLDRDLLGIYNVLTSPEEAVFVSAISAKEAYLFLRLQKLFPNAMQSAEKEMPLGVAYCPEAALEYLAQLRNDPTAAELTDCLQQALPEGAAAMRKIYDQADYTPGNLRQETVRQLYGKKISLSASKIDRLAKCGCAYFLQYGLHAQERKPVKFDASDYGNLAHFVFEKTGRAVVAEGGFHQVSLERTLELARDAIDAYTRQEFPDLQDKPERFGYLYRRNQQEILETVKDLFDELKWSQFEPEGFEVHFSSTGQMPSIRVVGKLATGEITGFVDRVDLYRNGTACYARVVDYKTGQQDFDYTDILNGIGLQMLIYLFALKNGGQAAFGVKLQPGGVLYIPARWPMISVQQKNGLIGDERIKQRRRKGLLLNDALVLQAMETTDSPCYLPCSYDKEGTPKGDLASREQLKQVENFVFRTLADMTDSIACGNVTPYPYDRGDRNNACAYCPYHSVCHVDAGCVQKKVRAKISKDTFWQEMEGKNHG